MARDTLAEARQVIERRLQELRRETHELETALRRLGGRAAKASTPKPRRRSSTKRSTGRKTRRRSPGSGRGDEFKQLLAKKPGAPVSEIANSMGISSQHGHGIAKRLRDRGEIEKQGKGYALKS